MAQNKLPGFGLAVGYWGRNGSQHIQALQTAQRVLVLNRDKIQAMGLPFNVWTRLTTASEPRSVQCSCFRETTQQSDSPCLSCYGMRWQPGFLRFGYRTTFYSSIHTDLTLTGVVKDTVNTPNRLVLAPGVLTGTIVTPPFAIPDTNLGTWTAKLDAFARDQANTILGEFSLDGGLTWTALVALGTVGNNPTLGGTIQFRITMTRPAATTKSPMFEVIRARYPVISPMRKEDMAPGEILLLKTWDIEKFVRDPQGKSAQSQGEKYWTLPLNLFDPRIAQETKDSLLGPDHFLEDARGVQAGTRFVSTQHAYSRTFKIFTRQEFNMRQLVGEQGNQLLGEALAKVW